LRRGARRTKILEAVAVSANLPASDPNLGRVIAGRFTLVERLGDGASGSVYRATQAPRHLDVAVKILRADRAVDADARARFLREAQTMSRLSSPHTVRVLDFGEAEHGELFIAMERLVGESLAERLRRRGRFDVDATFDVIRQALRSLAEAHAKGVIHRDLKPANLFFASAASGDPAEEVVKVLDFGVAKWLEAGPSKDLLRTLSGTVLGTPCYMSPEQALGRPLDARSDFYSLGVIAYELLVGQPPFIDETNLLVMAHHVRTAPPPLRRVAPGADLSATVEATILRFLSKDPAARPESAEAMEAMLDHALASQRRAISGVRPALAPRWRAALGAAFGPDAPRATASNRTDETVRTRAVASRHRETVAIVMFALLITAIAFWMWTRGAP
jgi:serine/threonine-protein kinase